MRAAIAAVAGALCGAGWFASLEPSAQLACRDSDLECLVPLLFLIVPGLVVVWALVGWGLLRVARFSPAWPTAAAGAVASVVLLLICVFSLRFVQVQLPSDSGIFVTAFAAAGGYALAAAVTAGYGGRRDRTEHSGQDG
jgi:purine-cytosine permease-like protein